MRRSSRSTTCTPAVVGLSLALALGLSACGDEATTTSAQSQEQSANEAAEVSPGDTVNGADLAERMKAAMTEAGSGRFTSTSSAQGQETLTEAAFSVEGGDYSIQGTSTSGSDTIELILVDGQMYVRTNQMGEKWVLVSEDSEDPTIAMMAAMMAQLEDSMNPRVAVDLYAQAGDFTVRGPDEVDGVKATVYTGSLPVEALAAQLPEDMRAATLEALGTEPIPVEVWLDAEDRPARLVQSMTVMGATSTTTQEYQAWGEPVEVEAPAADELQG